MVMVSRAGGSHRKGGRSPPPKRGRLGGGRCAAAPYKHRLAHDPGRRSRSGRAFRCVGVLGFTPSRFWAHLASQKCHPGGSRTNQVFQKTFPAVRRLQTISHPGGSRTNQVFQKTCPAVRRLQTRSRPPRRQAYRLSPFGDLSPPSGACKLFHNHPAGRRTD